MIQFARAVFYALFQASVVRITVVRRYVDAQKHFIGELYLGEGRDAHMIGMSCDNLPFNVGTTDVPVVCRLNWTEDFLAPMTPNTLRVGGVDPETHDAVREKIALRRFCVIRVTVLNRFIEHVLEDAHV